MSEKETSSAGQITTIVLSLLGVLVALYIVTQAMAENKKTAIPVTLSPKPSPCEFPYDTTVKFNGNFVGMRKKLFKQIPKEIPYKGQTEEGVIKFHPFWSGDTLVSLKLMVEEKSLTGYVGHDLVNDVFQDMKAQYMKGWEPIPDLVLGSDGFYQGRIQITVFPSFDVIFISDRCYERRMKEQQAIRDSIDREKSKEVFK